MGRVALGGRATARAPVPLAALCCVLVCARTASAEQDLFPAYDEVLGPGEKCSMAPITSTLAPNPNI
jgi:hypothetical protein